MQLIDTLNRLGDKVQTKYPWINHGGCAVYASLVGQELLNRRFAVRGIVAAAAASKECCIDRIRRDHKPVSISDWAMHGVHMNHVGLEIIYAGITYKYDTRGLFEEDGTLDSMAVYPGRLRIKEIAVMADNEHGWNPTFNRKYIKAVARMVKKEFAGLDKSKRSSVIESLITNLMKTK